MGDAVQERSAPPIPAASIVVITVWNLLGLAAFAALPPFHVFLLVWPIVIVVVIAVIVRSRHQMSRPLAERVSATGRVLGPPPSPGPAGPPMADITATDVPLAAWTGAGALPTGFGRMNATAPLVRLSVGPGGLTITCRPRVISFTFGYRTTTYQPDDIETVVPVVRRRLSGVAICPKVGIESFVWTSDRVGVLGALARAGYPVDWHELEAIGVL